MAATVELCDTTFTGQNLQVLVLPYYHYRASWQLLERTLCQQLVKQAVEQNQ